LEDRFDDPPGLLSLVAPDEEGGVAFQQVEEDALVGREELLGGEPGS